MLAIGADGNGLKRRSVVSPGWTWLYLAVIAVYFYLVLFLPPLTPFYYSSDASMHLSNARRMLAGETPYRDFFQFSLPGMELLYYGLFKLFGVRLWLPNIVMVLVGVTFAWLGLVVSRRVMSPGLAFLPGSLFAVAMSEWVFTPSHHWLSVLAIMGAMALLLDRRTTSRTLLAGLLCGIATCFTQNRGLVALLGFAIFLGWESRNAREQWRSLVKKQVLVLVGFLAAVVVVNSYFVKQAGWNRFIFCTVTFGITHYPAVNTFWTVLDQIPLGSRWYGLSNLLVWAMVNSGVPFIAPWFLLRYAKPSRPRPAAWEQLVLIASISLASTLAVAPSPSPFRLTAGALPALVLLVWHLDSPARWCGILRRAVWAGVLIAISKRVIWTGAQIAASAALGWHVPWTGVLDTASGRLAFLAPSTYVEYKWIHDRTCPGDYFFDLHWVDRYWFLGLRNPTSTPFFTPTDYTTPEQVADAVAGLEARPTRFILWHPEMAPVDVSSSPADHLNPLRVYLHAHYQLREKFTNRAQVWERMDFWPEQGHRTCPAEATLREVVGKSVAFASRDGSHLVRPIGEDRIASRNGDGSG